MIPVFSVTEPPFVDWDNLASSKNHRLVETLNRNTRKSLVLEQREKRKGKKGKKGKKGSSRVARRERT